MTRSAKVAHEAALDALLVREARLVARARRLVAPAADRRRLDRAERRQALALAADLATLIADLAVCRDATGQNLDTSRRTVSASLAYLSVGRVIAR